MNFVIRIFYQLLILSSNLFAQQYLNEQLKTADSLFNAEKYFDAITEYKRLLYFDSTKQFSFQANFKIGLAYKEGGKYSEAIKYFGLAEVNAINSEQIFESKIYQVRTNILRMTVLRADKILDELENDNRFAGHLKEIKYWKAWGKIFADEWEEAYHIFSQINETKLARLCLNTQNKFYSVDFAKYSSMIFPGFGQFYTGEYISGLLSLGWNIFSGYLTISAFNAERIFDGIVSANLLWFRFYRGNFQNAEKFAREKNISITNETLQFLNENFDGLKP
ncbi:tol-pal system YbgF family protein [Ignavibacterium album]|uniref:tetratricopeptide repeat protein n=1 Tax=Ignavibacterium album TaxID=591197 RepID=UPI0026EA76AE|nr:tetratricopeptide repeat protein [Ignavibacterium album]